MRPLAVPTNIVMHNQPVAILKEKIKVIRENMLRFYAAEPEISVIIPAYNEEGSILKTLSSLSASITGKSFEVIVVNNNSLDGTGELAVSAGAVCIDETTQGITHARNTGLRRARGRFILNADADTIYPPAWIDLTTAPLFHQNNVLVYGSYAFLPSSGTGRLAYLGYEYMADVSKWLNGQKEEAVNVYGFNSAFRRLQGLQVEGFNHPPGTNEDGWLAVKLRGTFSGKLCFVSGIHSMPWTSDRRIQADGGLLRGTVKRIRRFV